MELRSRRKALVSSTVQDNNDRKNGVLARSSSRCDQDGSDSSDEGHVIKKKARSLQRKNRPKKEVEIEEPHEPNNDFDHSKAVLEEPQTAAPSEPEKPRKKGRKKKEPKPVLMWQVWEEENERWLDENVGKDFQTLVPSLLVAVEPSPPLNSL